MATICSVVVEVANSMITRRSVPGQRRRRLGASEGRQDRHVARQRHGLRLHHQHRQEGQREADDQCRRKSLDCL